MNKLRHSHKPTVREGKASHKWTNRYHQRSTGNFKTTHPTSKKERICGTAEFHVVVLFEEENMNGTQFMKNLLVVSGRCADQNLCSDIMMCSNGWSNKMGKTSRTTLAY